MLMILFLVLPMKLCALNFLILWKVNLKWVWWVNFNFVWTVGQTNQCRNLHMPNQVYIENLEEIQYEKKWNQWILLWLQTSSYKKINLVRVRMPHSIKIWLILSYIWLLVGQTFNFLCVYVIDFKLILKNLISLL